MDAEQWQEESEEISYGVRYEGTEDYAVDWGSDLWTVEEAWKQVGIMERKYGAGFCAVEVRTVQSVRRAAK